MNSKEFETMTSCLESGIEDNYAPDEDWKVFPLSLSLSLSCEGDFAKSFHNHNKTQTTHSPRLFFSFPKEAWVVTSVASFERVASSLVSCGCVYNGSIRMKHLWYFFHVRVIFHLWYIFFSFMQLCFNLCCAKRVEERWTLSTVLWDFCGPKPSTCAKRWLRRCSTAAPSGPCQSFSASEGEVTCTDK